MNLMLPSARRKDGAKQPCIKIWKFDLRIPFVHYEWEIPEMIQACVVFMTGSAATAYLQDLFGFTFEMALSIVFVHELLYMVNNTLGDPLIGGWITPAVPLITAFLLNFEGIARMHALVGMELLLGLIYVILGATGIATKIIDICPQSLKAGILIGSGFAACVGPYGFKALDAGGKGFFMYPVSWSIGCCFGLFLLFSNGFAKVKLGGIIAWIIGEVDLPDFSTVTSFWFNPLPGLKWVWGNFSILGIGIPPASILAKDLPMAIMCYVIAFGDIVGGTAFMEDTKRYREDEYIDVNPDRTNMCCGFRNLIEAFFSPTCTMSGLRWFLHLQHHQVDLPADRASDGSDQAHPASGHGPDPDHPGLWFLLRRHQHDPHQRGAWCCRYHRRCYRHLRQPIVWLVRRYRSLYLHGDRGHEQEGAPRQHRRGYRDLSEEYPRRAG